MDDAIEEATAAIQVAPESVSAYTARGYAQLLRKHSKEALADFDRCGGSIRKCV